MFKQNKDQSKTPKSLKLIICAAVMGSMATFYLYGDFYKSRPAKEVKKDFIEYKIFISPDIFGPEFTVEQLNKVEEILKGPDILFSAHYYPVPASRLSNLILRDELGKDYAGEIFKLNADLGLLKIHDYLKLISYNPGLEVIASILPESIKKFNIDVTRCEERSIFLTKKNLDKNHVFHNYKIGIYYPDNSSELVTKSHFLEAKFSHTTLVPYKKRSEFSQMFKTGKVDGVLLKYVSYNDFALNMKQFSNDTELMENIETVSEGNFVLPCYVIFKKKNLPKSVTTIIKKKLSNSAINNSLLINSITFLTPKETADIDIKINKIREADLLKFMPTFLSSIKAEVRDSEPKKSESEAPQP